MDERSTVMESGSRRCRSATSIKDRKCRSRLMRTKAAGKDCHGLPRSMKRRPGLASLAANEECQNPCRTTVMDFLGVMTRLLMT